MQKREILTTIFTTLISVFLVAGIVLAVTTIGSDISTDGSLTVGGNTTIAGNLEVTGAATLTDLSAYTASFDYLDVPHITGTVTFDDGWINVAAGSIVLQTGGDITDFVWGSASGGRIYAGGGVRTDGDIIMDSSASLSIPAGALSDASVLTEDLADLAVKKSKIDYEVVSVDVIPGADNGTTTITSGAEILGFYPTTNDGKAVNSIEISATTLTLTVNTTSTATSTFNIVLIKP
jgi:hypothetical protein